RCVMKLLMKALLVPLALLATALPALASDKYVVQENKPMEDGRRPEPGKALVYFARTQTMGFAVKVKLYADGKFIGLIHSKTFIPADVDPGKHEFIVEAENAGFLKAEVEAGKIYVVQVSIHMGAMKARTHFETARTGSEALEEFLKEQKNLRAVTTTEEGTKWVQEEDAKIQETIAKYREKGEEIESLKPGDGFDAPPWISRPSGSAGGESKK